MSQPVLKGSMGLEFGGFQKHQGGQRGCSSGTGWGGGDEGGIEEEILDPAKQWELGPDLCLQR